MRKKYSDDLILVAAIIVLVAILHYIGQVYFSSGFFGVSEFYIGAAFLGAFAIWFGYRALLGIYIGLLIGAVFAGTFTVFSPILALGRIIGASIPMFAFRYCNADMGLGRLKDYIIYIFSAACQIVVSGTYGVLGRYLVGLIPAADVPMAQLIWIAGGLTVCLLIGIPLLKLQSPIVKRSRFYVGGGAIINPSF